MKNNPEKDYAHIGISTVVDQMEGKRFQRQQTSVDRWKTMARQATPVFRQLIGLAGKNPRNIILDDTHVSKDGRRRRAGAFQDFGTRRCVTIVNTVQMLGDRAQKQARAKCNYFSYKSANELRAKFDAPELNDGFTHLEWPELLESDALSMIDFNRWIGLDWKSRNEGGQGLSVADLWSTSRH